jgi:serine/threonine protein kinase
MHELFLEHLPFNMGVCYGNEDIKSLVCEEDFTFGFSDHIGMNLWDILNKMFRKDRNFRPTIDKLKKHDFFTEIDWDKLASQDLPPPFQPKVVPPANEFDSDIVFSKIPPYEGDDPFHWLQSVSQFGRGI